MLAKVLIIVMLLVIIFNLGAGLVYLMKDRGSSTRTVRALTWRVGLSFVLLILLIAGFATGVIRPHSALPTSTQPTEVEP